MLSTDLLEQIGQLLTRKTPKGRHKTLTNENTKPPLVKLRSSIKEVDRFLANRKLSLDQSSVLGKKSENNRQEAMQKTSHTCKPTTSHLFEDAGLLHAIHAKQFEMFELLTKQQSKIQEIQEKLSEEENLKILKEENKELKLRVQLLTQARSEDRSTIQALEQRLSRLESAMGGCKDQKKNEPIPSKLHGLVSPPRSRTNLFTSSSSRLNERINHSRKASKA